MLNCDFELATLTNDSGTFWVLTAHDLLNSQNYSKNHFFGKSFWKLLRLVSDIELDTELDTELDIEQDMVPISARDRTVLDHCGCFYRTRVRSLGMFVTN